MYLYELLAGSVVMSVLALVIFRPRRWESRYISERLAAVMRMEDQSHRRLLIRISRSDKDGGVREAAVKRLTDQAALASIANSDKASYVRKAAVKRLTDQAALASIANSDKDSYVREAAVERLTDQAMLADVAKTDSDHSVRWVAAEKLTDQAMLADVAKNASDHSVRRAAAEKLTDQALAQTVFADVAKNASDHSVCKAAVEKLTDQAMLADVAKTARDYSVRWAAADKLADQALAHTVFAELREVLYETICGEIDKAREEALRLVLKEPELGYCDADHASQAWYGEWQELRRSGRLESYARSAARDAAFEKFKWFKGELRRIDMQAERIDALRERCCRP